MKHFTYISVFLSLLIANAVTAQDLPTVDSLAVAKTGIVATDSASIALRDSVSSVADSSANAKRKGSAFKTRVKYKSNDSVIFNLPTKHVYMYKETQINYDDIELKAYKTDFDMGPRVIYASGGRDSVNTYIESPHFKQGGNEFDCDSMSYNFTTSKGVIHHIKTKQGEGYLQATKSKRYPDGHVYMGGGIYTTCDADHPHFGLRLSKAKLIPGDQVVFGPAYMELLDIPLYVLFLPFGFFPQTNKEAVSGIIPPSYGIEVSRGLSLTNGGYYMSFGDHFDAQVLGDIYSTGTWRVQFTSRYINRYKFSGDMNLSYGTTVTGEKGLDYAETKQYSIVWNHRQDAKANPYRNFQASVNYSSSKYEKEFNYTNADAFYNNTKNSSISFSQRWPNTPFSFSTNFRTNQTSTNQMVTIDFPNFSFRVERIYPFRKEESTGKAKWYEDISLQYDANLQNTLTGKEDSLFIERNFRNMKNGFQHKVPFSINFKVLKFVNITPSLNYTGVLYGSRIKKTFYADSISPYDSRAGVIGIDTIRGLSYAHILAPTMSVSMTPKFFLTNIYGQGSKVEAIRTTISPNVGVSYTPDVSRWFNYYETITTRDDKPHQYSIYEGQGVYSVPASPRESGSVSLGLNGVVEMKVRSLRDSTAKSKKIKLLNNVSARTSYNIFADSMKWSAISLSANTTIYGINLTASGNVDPYKLTPIGTRIDKYGPRLTSVTFNTGISLPINREGKSSDSDADKDKDKKKKEDFAYFDVPWNLSVNYGLSYSKPQFEGKFTQTLSFSGNVNFTKKWSLNFSASYDFEAKKIAYTTASIQRDLHCWQMSINFSPFGANKFYFFLINVKASTLRDLKYEQRKTQSDFSHSGGW